jgi:hypothetical protein
MAKSIFQYDFRGNSHFLSLSIAIAEILVLRHLLRTVNSLAFFSRSKILTRQGFQPPESLYDGNESFDHESSQKTIMFAGRLILF